MTRHLSAALAATLALVAVPLSAADGILVVQKTTTAAGTQTHNVQIDQNRVRAETEGRGGGTQSVIFDGAKQTLWIINDARKTYTELTKADVDRIGAQMSGMMAQMQEQMKNMPPEQRERMEAMMRGRGAAPAAAAAAKPTYKKVGTATVGKWTCDQYEGYEGDKKTSEVCTVDPKALGFTAADFQVTRQLADFFGALMPQNMTRMFAIGSAEQQGFSGVPVRQVTITGDQRVTSELVDAKRTSFPPSTFDVPAGYTKEAAMAGGRGRQ